MPRKPATKPDDAAQSKRFIETAKELEADDSPEAFDKAFRDVTARRPKVPAAGE